MTQPIEINARFLTQPVTGVQRFAVELVRSLDRGLSSSSALRDRFRFRLLGPHSARDMKLEHIPLIRTGRLDGHRWEQLELPFAVGRRVLLNLGNTAPLATRNVVTIHDASVFAMPEAYTRAFRLWYRVLLPVLGRTAARVVTISEFSRAELSRRAGIPGHVMEVVPQGCEHILETPPDHGIFSRVPVSPGGYLLAVGSRSPHKNLGLLASAHGRLGSAAPPLVMAGGVNPRVFGEGVTANHARGVHSAGYVTDGELRALYEGACCFVFPSLYEGFGIPPLEAMLCGCPTIVSRAASLPEVCGDGALYTDPRDPDDLASKIRELVENPGRREDLRRRGLKRARGFTWERASGRLVEILDRVTAR